jgi:hypothetical protein
MSLNLDLLASKAKVTRALEHVDTLEVELRTFLRENAMYRVSFKLDSNTGWCSVTLASEKVAEPRLPVLLGDAVQNLRSALDYVVAALIEASNAALTTQHQFPIFAREAEYLKKVGPPTATKPNGPLGGICYGAHLIESLQPYKRQPNPKADQLWAVHRFSNADKHRQLATRVDIPLTEGADPIEFMHDGTLVERVDFEEVSDWTPDGEHEIGRLRFDPMPTYLKPNSNLPVGILFTTGPFGNEPDTPAIEVRSLRETCEYVGTVVDLFETI